MLMDVNGDGLQDLLFRNAYMGDRGAVTVIYARDSQGGYVEAARQDFGAYALLVADMDGDGLDDVVAVVQTSGYSYIGVGFTKRTGGFELSNWVPLAAFDTMNQATVGIADLDVDGVPDVVLDSYNTGLSVLFPRVR